MAVRELNGWFIHSTAVQVEPSSMFYRPGVLVRKEGFLEGRTYLLEHLDASEMSEDEAHRRANGYILTVHRVTDEGFLWDRPID
jgi:hypothetical protein